MIPGRTPLPGRQQPPQGSGVNNTARRQLKLPPSAWLALLIIALQLINVLTGYRLNQFGISPRQLPGLLGIPLAPLLHADWTHLLGNLPPLLVLGTLINLRGWRCYLQVTLGISLLAGLGTWLFGRHGLHLGASALVLGYWSYLIASAGFRRDPGSLLLALLALFLYGGLLATLTDFSAGISVSGHLFGLLAGIALARWHST